MAGAAGTSGASYGVPIGWGSLARMQVTPQRRSAMVEAIEFDDKVLLGLADDPTVGASPNRLAWAFCLTVKSVELDDGVSPVAQVAVAVQRTCRPFAAASGRAELARPRCRGRAAGPGRPMVDAWERRRPGQKLVGLQEMS